MLFPSLLYGSQAKALARSFDFPVISKLESVPAILGQNFFMPLTPTSCIFFIPETALLGLFHLTTHWLFCFLLPICGPTFLSACLISGLPSSPTWTKQIHEFQVLSRLAFQELSLKSVIGNKGLTKLAFRLEQSLSQTTGFKWHTWCVVGGGGWEWGSLDTWMGPLTRTATATT